MQLPESGGCRFLDFGQSDGNLSARPSVNELHGERLKTLIRLYYIKHGFAILLNPFRDSTPPGKALKKGTYCYVPSCELSNLW